MLKILSILLVGLPWMPPEAAVCNTKATPLLTAPEGRRLDLLSEEVASVLRDAFRIFAFRPFGHGDIARHTPGLSLNRAGIIFRRGHYVGLLRENPNGEGAYFLRGEAPSGWEIFLGLTGGLRTPLLLLLRAFDHLGEEPFAPRILRRELGFTESESYRILEAGTLTGILLREGKGIYRFVLTPSEAVREAAGLTANARVLFLESLGAPLHVWDRAILLPESIFTHLGQAFEVLGHLPHFTLGQYAPIVGMREDVAYGREIQLGLVAGAIARGPVDDSFVYRKTPGPSGWEAFGELPPEDPIPRHMRKAFGHFGDSPFNATDLQEALHLGSKTTAIKLINAGLVSKVLRATPHKGVYAFVLAPPREVSPIPPDILGILEGRGVPIEAWTILYTTDHRPFNHMLKALSLTRDRPLLSVDIRGIPFYKGKNTRKQINIDRAILAGVLAPLPEHPTSVVFAMGPTPRGWAAFESLGLRGNRDLDYLRRAVPRFKGNNITLHTFAREFGMSRKESSVILINASLAGVTHKSIRGLYVFDLSSLEGVDAILAFYAGLRRIGAPEEVWSRAHLLDPHVLSSVTEAFRLFRYHPITPKDYGNLPGVSSGEEATRQINLALIGGLFQWDNTPGRVVFRKTQAPSGLQAFDPVGEEFDGVVENLVVGALHFRGLRFTREQLAQALDLDPREVAEEILPLGLLSRVVREVAPEVYLFDRGLFGEEGGLLSFCQLLLDIGAPRSVWKRAFQLDRPTLARMVDFFKEQGFTPFTLGYYQEKYALSPVAARKDVKTSFLVGLLEGQGRDFSFRKKEGPLRFALLEAYGGGLESSINNLKKAFDIFGWGSITPTELSRRLGSEVSRVAVKTALEVGVLADILVRKQWSTYAFVAPPPGLPHESGPRPSPRPPLRREESRPRPPQRSRAPVAKPSEHDPLLERPTTSREVLEGRGQTLEEKLQALGIAPGPWKEKASLVRPSTLNMLTDHILGEEATDSFPAGESDMMTPFFAGLVAKDQTPGHFLLARGSGPSGWEAFEVWGDGDLSYRLGEALEHFEGVTFTFLEYETYVKTFARDPGAISPRDLLVARLAGLLEQESGGRFSPRP